MNSPVLVRTLALTMAIATLAGCQAGPTAGIRPSERDPRVSGVVIVRSYDDEFKIDGRDVRVHVEYAWDYGKAVAIERIADENGELISLTDQPELTLNLTDAEKAYALELARSHPDLKEQIEQSDHLYGGFSYREASDPECFLRSRCVHVVASSQGVSGDGWRKLVHAIVDLQTGRVVHPHYAAGDVDPLDPIQLKAHKGKTP
jgi:hypothetical protein